MPAIQTTYGATIAPAVAGMIANMETANVVSRTLEDATALGFGKAAFQGAGDDGVTATPAANKFRGISVLDPTLAPASADAFQRYDSIGLIEKGVIWVTAGATIATAHVPVYVTSAGAFTDVPTSNALIPNATFESTGASGALVKVRIH